MKFIATTMEMVRGDSETVSVWLEDDNGHAPFVTGDTVYFTVKQDKFSTEKAFQKTVTTFVDGKAFVDILPADTKNMEFGRYFYDVQITFANGEVKTIVPCSQFVLKCEVTYE